MPTLRKVVFAALILTMASATAMACTCIAQSEAESFANADYVFIGKPTRAYIWLSQDATSFEIDRWLKGHKRGSVVISSHRTSCDANFFYGHTYVVYAKSVNGELMAGTCSGTRVIDDQFEPKRQFVPVCGNYVTRLSYQRIAAITALSVTFSISLGLLVGAIKRRFRK